VKRRIVAAVIVLSAVAVFAWKINRSDPSGYDTHQKAVIATCHADTNQPLALLPRGLVDGDDTVSVQRRSAAQPPGHSWAATADRNGSRNYEVRDCKKFQTHSTYRELS
jgi:hypothetical protein